MTKKARAPAPASDVAAAWLPLWPDALATWSPFTQIREPIFLPTDKAARAWGMAEEIAAIRLNDQLVMVNEETVRSRGLVGLGKEILAHEIGHHVYVPGNLNDNARMIAAIRKATLGLKGNIAGMLANLYGDLHINDRLQRGGLDMAAVYRKLKEEAGKGAPSKVWSVYTRTYEHLWRLPAGSLAPDGVTFEMNSDASFIARLVRHYAKDWLRGVYRFAVVMYPYLLDDEKNAKGQTFVSVGLNDTKNANRSAEGEDVVPDGLTGIGEEESGEDDEFDREMENPFGDEGGSDGTGRRKPKHPTDPNTEPTKEGQGRPGAQFREPFQYGELLRALGLKLSDHEITTRYYRERALPYLIPFPARKAPRSMEPLPEGYETWEPADSLEAMDLFGSILRSPSMVPGVTTVQRTFGESPGSDPAKVPMDLDIYIDTSGSMPNPAVEVSYLALAGAILALSALRMGARVQATLWSGTGSFQVTDGFTRDETSILGVLAGYIGGGTAFPIHILRKTWEARKPDDPPGHIVVISDDGVDTMLAMDEKAIPGEKVAKMALGKARGGGTLVLNIPKSGVNRLKKLSDVGFRIHAVQKWEELVEFARKFVIENYGD